jgi:hypothetical protein
VGRVSLSTIAFTLLITANRAFAIITGFLPGDACFGTSLSEATLSQFDSPNAVVFDYRPGEGAPALCGYAGYWKLAVREMPEEMKENLRKLYHELREYDPQQIQVSKNADGNEQRLETNPFQLFVYNKDYDLRQGIGLKFNEAWMKLDMQKYDKPTTGAYWPYVTDHEAVASDWEGSARVPGLAINEADARPWWGDRLETPVSIDADRIQILVLPEQLYKSFALGSGHWRDVPWDELPLELELDAVIEPHFYRVTSEGVTRCHYGDGFVEEPWPLTPAQMQAEKIEKIIGALDRAATETFSFGDEQPLPAEVQQDLYELREKMDALQEKLTELSESLKQQPAASPPPSNE